MHRSTQRRRLQGTLALMSAGVLVLAACGGDDSEGGAASGSGADAAALGSQAPAPTGSSLKIGLVSDGKGDVIDNTSEIEAAEAAVKYVNEYLGGAGGHPVDLVVCETRQIPSSATDCANKMVDEKVAAVLLGVSGQSGAIFTGLAPSGIPLVSFANIEQDVLTKPGSFVLTNGLASIAGPAGVAKENGVKKAAVLVTDVPAASGPVNQVGPVFYRNAGVELTVVTVPPDAADMTPQVQSAIQQGAEQIAMVGNPAFCTSALKAMKTLNFTGGIVLIPQCIDDTSAASIPGGYAGMKQITFTTNDPTDADFKAYGAVMDKYASGVNKGGVAPGGYVVVTGFARAFDGLTVEPTAAGITGALSAMTKPVKVPLGGGITFQCGTKPVAITPNICGGQALVADLDKDGNGSNYKLLDTAELTKL